ncbi:hypothetical protein PPSIR1_29228 [Plesiocystis pacifica SIR-1]|uniref:Uncharacterized protein n=1 Tax=Plesiocystis pacifica SIR-1 TaxID=391625 RepID=A6G613_9BACT|nr:hypothetical protein PPSIR1_29228 [Plesiocystis pacifica SIR-1]
MLALFAGFVGLVRTFGAGVV